ncbi:MAG: adenylate/guanylate cyclase with Chase sensor [Cyanobacteria bacterium RYN_339]|nr:adenylate/guanylate cyclase with Chase sensor [Cyanobacteria bacterium RYN_339]
MSPLGEKAAGALRAAAFGLLAAIIWWGLSWVGLLERPQWVGYHLLFEWRGPEPRPTDILLVALDEPTMEELAVWPLPRTVYAELIDGLFAAGAKVVALDVTFPQAQRPETDAALEAALARHQGQVVLAANFQPGQDQHQESRKLVLPIKSFRKEAAFGFVDLAFDADGGIHRFQALHEGVDLDDPRRTRRYPSFDLETATRLTTKPTAFPNEGLIDYVGPPGSFQTLSMISVLDAVKEGNKSLLAGVAGKAVLVGATSLRLQDQYPTPFSATAMGGGSATYMPGVEIHANVVHTLVHQRRIQQASNVPILLGTALAAGLACLTLAPWLSFLLALGTSVALALLSHLAFSRAGMWIDPVAPLGALWSLFVGGVGASFVRAERARRFYRRTFERYVAKDIVNELLLNPGLAPKLGGERREVTVLFSDIRSFTTISEERTPEQVVEFLNAYLTAMAEVIHRHHGSIDKYIGDAILALWGNVKPLPPEAAARHAVRTALAMKARVNELQPRWQAQGFPHIDIGIGVNTGEAVVGNIGSPERLEFGVIGDSVNVASRLEGLTKEYGGAIIVSARTRDLLGEGFECRFLANVKVKGRAQSVDIFAVERER